MMRSFALLPSGMGRAIRAGKARSRPSPLGRRRNDVAFGDGRPAVARRLDRARHVAVLRRGALFGEPALRGGLQPRRTDVDAIVFRRKAEILARVAPDARLSQQLARREAAASMLMSGMPRVVIPNTLDMEVFRPGDSAEARRRFGLPAQGRMILFGAAAGRADPIKGFDLLEAAIGRLSAAGSGDLFLATFGSRSSGRGRVAGSLPARSERCAIRGGLRCYIPPPTSSSRPRAWTICRTRFWRRRPAVYLAWRSISAACRTSSRPRAWSPCAALRRRSPRAGIAAVADNRARRGAAPSERTQRSGSDRRTSLPGTSNFTGMLLDQAKINSR